MWRSALAILVLGGCSPLVLMGAEVPITPVHRMTELQAAECQKSAEACTMLAIGGLPSTQQTELRSSVPFIECRVVDGDLVAVQDLEAEVPDELPETATCGPTENGYSLTMHLRWRVFDAEKDELRWTVGTMAMWRREQRPPMGDAIID